MGKRNKKLSNTPGHKRLKRSGRLQAAKHWIQKYNGVNLIKGYSKHFGVDKLCAVRELEMIGYTFSDAYKQELTNANIQMQLKTKKRNAAKKQKRQQLEEDFWNEDSDEIFAFIAGYTAGGAPYGITWEEEENNLDDINEERSTKLIDGTFHIDDPDLPF